jgi:selenocysteine lyase/cysteine desulfurase
MLNISRRQMVFGSLASTALLSIPKALQARNSTSPISAPLSASDAAWKDIQELYAVNREITNLENGYWGAMPQPVLAAYKENTDFINTNNTIYARTQFSGALEKVREQVARAVGADVSEIALTRGATEALQKLITGYNALQPGDVVAYSDLDYDSMQYAMNWLQQRRGAQVKTFNIPEPATRQNILEAYEKILSTPKLKLLLLTHLSHRTGLVIPVAEIAQMARAQGVDVIVDAAHSWGQIDFNVKDLSTDFVGFNLHKWISAPVGVGFMYIAKNRLLDIDPDYADEDYESDDIRSRVHTGTTNFAALLTVPVALQLHQKITAKAKQQRLTYLRDYWVDALRSNKSVHVLTPDDARLHAGITSFRFGNARDKLQNDGLVKTLRDQHGILTVRRGGIHNGDAIRVSPALFTRDSDMDKFIVAMNKLGK